MNIWLQDVRCDPTALTVVGAAMTLTAALALWIPARRAIAVDPTIALRSE